MMKEMNTGRPFELEFVSFDRKRKTGGLLVQMTQVVKHQAGRVAVYKGEAAPATEAPKRSTNPNHDYHGTINIKCRDNSIRKVRTRLITRFNGQEVAL